MMLTKVLKIAWIICFVTVLIVTLARCAPGLESDIGVFMVYGMLLLAFPISLLVTGLFALLALLQERTGIPLLDVIDSNYVGFSVMWITFFVAGYVQWFLLLPWLWRKLKARRSRGATPFV